MNVKSAPQTAAVYFLPLPLALQIDAETCHLLDVNDDAKRRPDNVIS